MTQVWLRQQQCHRLFCVSNESHAVCKGFGAELEKIILATKYREVFRDRNKKKSESGDDHSTAATFDDSRAQYVAVGATMPESITVKRQMTKMYEGETAACA